MKLPINLEECFKILEEINPPNILNTWKAVDEGTAIAKIHFSGGMKLRNDWNLWGENELTKYFNNLGLVLYLSMAY